MNIPMPDVVERKEFDNMEDLTIVLNRYFKDYDPRGYSTKAIIYYDFVNKCFVMELERFGSCD